MTLLSNCLKKYRQRTFLGYFAVGAFSGFVTGFLVATLMRPSCPTCPPVDTASSLRIHDRQALALPQDHRDCSDVCDDLHKHQVACPKHCNDDEGWSLVHVYYGNTSHITDASGIPKEYYQNTRWFSQLKQDQIVNILLKRKKHGYFVDLAANDAIRISNTYALETYNEWSGLCMEPNPMYWAGLSYRKCDVVGAVVGETNMEEVKFKYPNRAGPKGGIVGKEFDNKEPSQFGEDHLRFTVTLLEVFERFNTPRVIDYLSLDVEGAEELVMKAFPFDQYRFNIMTIERPSEVLKNLLESHGYKLLKQLRRWGEQVWIHQSIESSLDMSALDIQTEDYKYREFPSKGIKGSRD